MLNVKLVIFSHLRSVCALWCPVFPFFSVCVLNVELMCDSLSLSLYLLCAECKAEV